MYRSTENLKNKFFTTKFEFCILKHQSNISDHCETYDNKR